MLKDCKLKNIFENLKCNHEGCHTEDVYFKEKMINRKKASKHKKHFNSDNKHK